MKTIIFLIVVLFSGCSIERTVPKRPTNVSGDFGWVGGVDGGCWIRCTKVDNHAVACSVLYRNGQLWDKGLYVSERDSIKFPLEINYFNGDDLILRDETKLKKLKDDYPQWSH